MQISLTPYIAIPLAVIALSTAIGIWYYLLRPVPELQQSGMIEKIEFAAKQIVKKTEVRSLRNADDPLKKTQYTLPDRFIYTIKLEDGKIALYEEIALHSKANPEYKMGMRMQVTYQLRSLPFGKEKIMVIQIGN